MLLESRTRHGKRGGAGRARPPVFRGVALKLAVRRTSDEIERLRRNENTRLPDDIDFDAIGGLSNEIKQKLKEVRPETVAQASRIQGVTPAAISQVLVHLKKRDLLRKQSA